MNKHILLSVVLAVTLTACGECSKNAQQTTQQSDDVCGHFMTNTQIIEETKLCHEAGLDAEALHCGEDHQTVIVQCKPRAGSEE